jgi:hypothetical protein
VWCFDGEFVVECVAEMDWKQRAFWRLKMRHEFELYFRVETVWLSCVTGRVALEKGMFSA